MNKKILLITLFAIAILLASTQTVSASIKLEGVSSDPAIIAAGDEVDIIVNFRNVDYNTDTANEQETLQVKFFGADLAAQQYITIFDEDGEGRVGHLFVGENWRSIFRMKVHANAPPGTYEFGLDFTKTNEFGELIDGKETKYFSLEIKKEGVNLIISNIQTLPAEVRSGDEYVKIDLYLENVGEKDSKSVGISLLLPEEFKHTYSNANTLRIGRLNAGEQKALSFYIDIVDGVDAKVYDIPIKIKYLDLDNNEYSALKEFKLLIKEKPQIQVINYSGSGLAGKKGILEVSLQNVGSETAEAVDVRLIKQSSQPFAFDVRSAYVGQLEPGETGLAIFNIDISRNAEFKEHDFKLFIRAKGDSDNGNNNIYTYSDRAKFSVDGKAPNYFLYIGLGILGLIILIVLIRIFSR